MWNSENERTVGWEECGGRCRQGKFARTGKWSLWSSRVQAVSRFGLRSARSKSSHGAAVAPRGAPGLPPSVLIGLLACCFQFRPCVVESKGKGKRALARPGSLTAREAHCLSSLPPSRGRNVVGHRTQMGGDTGSRRSVKDRWSVEGFVLGSGGSATFAVPLPCATQAFPLSPAQVRFYGRPPLQSKGALE